MIGIYTMERTAITYTSEVLVYLSPVFLAILGYVVSIERRLSRILTDISWIKANFKQPHKED